MNMHRTCAISFALKAQLAPDLQLVKGQVLLCTKILLQLLALQLCCCVCFMQMGPAVAHASFSHVLIMPCATDWSGHYVRQLLAPAFSTVPAAAEIPTLF